MLNRDIYQKDPSIRKLVNEGVANVNDEMSPEALEVLRYEVETFVCDGQYDKGLAHILETYLRNIDQAQQPAVWISGFYGSGKSHLVKMLRALWMDIEFADHATARGIAQLSERIRDNLKELTVQARRHGGLHAASGTLGAGASGSVRLALLRIIFKSVGLPEQYPVAKFVMWLKAEGIYNQVRELVEKNSYNWDEELDNFYVAEGLHQALTTVKPNLFETPSSCRITMINLYPHVNDISRDELIKAIKQALTKEGKFPLTLIVLDEIQQYIGEDSQRSMDVQEVVEACCQNIGGKLLFIGTGQTAVTGTPNLRRLEGRFTVRIELSDTDVDAVIRKVILAKKAEAKEAIEKIMQTNLGEISRQLSGTTIGHRQEDVQYFHQDYPILPIRRRFWESTFRVLDQTGTQSQLRNQLSMIHKVVQTNLNQPLGHVIAADYLYFDSADKLLQARVLPRGVHERTMHWYSGTDDERLMARACGLVFLINKLTGHNNEIGIKATVNTLADLLVEDLVAGGSSIRGRLPNLLDHCELLMKVGDEYRIQTEESQAWNDEFISQKARLSNEVYRVDSERDDRIRQAISTISTSLNLQQGVSRVSRSASFEFNTALPADANKKIYVWIRDGWNTDENSVRADARQAGLDSPTVFVFIPKRSVDELRNQILEFKAASSTLEHRGFPNSPEGIEARSAMETTKQNADRRIKELISESISGARVFQAGGNEVLGDSLKVALTEATKNSVQRLYHSFAVTDNPNWAKVYTKAQQGAPDALKEIGDQGDPANNAVCKAIQSMIGPGKKGADVRNHFEAAPYGWSRDAVDGALQVLLVSGLIKAQDEIGHPIRPTDLARSAIGKTLFKIESTTVTTIQRIKIRSLFQTLNITATPGDELQHVISFISKIEELASQAGGDAPLPMKPDISDITVIKLASGNEQLISLFSVADDLKAKIIMWRQLADQINTRSPNWQTLKNLMKHAEKLGDIDVISTQVKAIEENRQLLSEPDPVKPLIVSVAQMLRDELNRIHKEMTDTYRSNMERLEADSNWQQLEPEQRDTLLNNNAISPTTLPKINVQNTDAVLRTLEQHSISVLNDRLAAIPERFARVTLQAAKLCAPDIQVVHVPSRTLQTEADIQAWISEVEQRLKSALSKGPIVIQ